MRSKEPVVNLCIGAGWLFANSRVGGGIRQALWPECLVFMWNIGADWLSQYKHGIVIV